MSTFIGESRTSIDSGVSFPGMLEDRLARMRPRERDRLVWEIASHIALLAPYLEPCYRKAEEASFPSLSARFDDADESARRLRAGVAIVSGWFISWRDRLTLLPERPKHQEVLRLVEELDLVLHFTGLFGAELHERTGVLDPNDPARVTFLSVADRYDRFLADYERVWSASVGRFHDLDDWPTLPREPYYERIRTRGSDRPR